MYYMICVVQYIYCINVRVIATLPALAQLHLN